MYCIAGRSVNDQSKVQSPETGDRRLETSPPSSQVSSLKSQASSLRCEYSAIRNPRSAIASPGFTLLEVVVAMAVLAVALVSLLGLYHRNLQQTIQTQRLSVAMLLAQEILTRTQLEGRTTTPQTTGDFVELHPGQYPEFRWQRTVYSTPLAGLWEVRVAVSWGERADEVCELTLFTPLEGL
jgi:general secretion pathway protein I